MTFDQKVVWVMRVRARARRHGCECGRTGIELGIKSGESLNRMVRRGAHVSELKTAIREHGWWCRRCVRRWKGTAAPTQKYRDRFPPGPEGERLYQYDKFERSVPVLAEKGIVLYWDDDIQRGVTR